MEAPGLCSPSRKVVSKIINLSLLVITDSCYAAASHITEAHHRGGEFYKKGGEFVSKKYFARYGSRHSKFTAKEAGTAGVLIDKKMLMSDNIGDKVCFAKAPDDKKV